MLIQTEKEIRDANFNDVQSLTTFNGNRTINRLHVKNIAAQMEEDLRFFPPITVNRRTNHIIDGQHRIAAFKTLVREGRIPADSTISIMYVECSPEEERELTINANVNSKKWSLDDYIRSFAQDNEEYSRLIEWCKRHPMMYENLHMPGAKITKGGFRYRFAAAILTGKTCQSSLKDGTFSATDEGYAVGDVIYDELKRIFEVLGKGRPSSLERVAILWHERRKLHPFDDWLKMLKKKKLTYQRMPIVNSKDWEAIFNKIHTDIDKSNQL